MSLKVPSHLAIIMDGNRRWAKMHNLPHAAGHQAGVKALKRVINSALELGIHYLTVYAFSAENWHRSPQEIEDLMYLLRSALIEESLELAKNNVKLNVIGEKNTLSSDIIESIRLAEERTLNNSRLQLNVALNYGGRQEIIEAIKRLISQGAPSNLEEIDINYFAKFLYTANIPDPDLLIRTSGEVRLSNFFLWQISYTELYFTKTLWPDFSHNDILKAIETYSKRERRYGKSNF